MKNSKIEKILKKKGKDPICCLTAYSKNIAAILDKYCDIILVGDSLGMVLYGMKSTKEINIDTMILHAKAVKKHSKKSIVVFDMPYRTYTNKILAYKNALKVIKKTKCDAIKLEGGKKIANIVKYLVKKGIPVMGHIGLLPQHSKKYKVQGKKLIQKKEILNDAKKLYESGVFAVVIECVLENLARKITKEIPIPTIGIGASKHCDGQILVSDDMLGMSNYYPKFVKKYSSISRIIEKSVKAYCQEVKLKKFPSRKHVYIN
tara:strand:+ start:3199 stop:3981 length:783 start_codon:yes stop_codon:yes gene_type:complete